MFRSCFEPLCSHRPISRFTTIAGRGHADHHRAVGDLGLADPADRFPSDQEGDHHQGHGVRQRGEHADAVVAERHPVVGRLAREPRARTS